MVSGDARATLDGFVGHKKTFLTSKLIYNEDDKWFSTNGTASAQRICTFRHLCTHDLISAHMSSKHVVALICAEEESAGGRLVPQMYE
jgi:hypothetical protein